jgi:DNA-3-methyladenine glycosylase II
VVLLFSYAGFSMSDAAFRSEMNNIRLTEASLAAAAEELANRDKHLRLIFQQYGPPPLWARRPGFQTLVRIILEQQVSLASAASMFARLQANINPFQPARFLELGPDHLRTLGLTRQKTAYLIHLAESIHEKRIDLRKLSRLDDAGAKSALTELKGIGSWSADIYLLMALRRPDIWPSGDLALAIAVAKLKRLETTPGAEELLRMGKRWRPYRAVAARMLWQYYLAQRNRL